MGVGETYPISATAERTLLFKPSAQNSGIFSLRLSASNACGTAFGLRLRDGLSSLEEFSDLKAEISEFSKMFEPFGAF